MSQTFTVDVTVSPETLVALIKSGYTLYLLQAVSSSDKATVPTAWLATSEYLRETQISWTDAYQAYTSSTGSGIIETTAVAIQLDETATVDADGKMAVVGRGTPGAVSINNLATREWTTGIAREGDDLTYPICAQPLYGLMLAVIAPIDRMLLMFATESFGPGDPVLQTYAPAVLIDFTGVTERQVTFDIDDGWSWGGEPWAQQIAAGQNLVPYLIDRPA